MAAASATLDFVSVLIPTAARSMNKKKKKKKIINNVFLSFWLLLFCRRRRRRSDRTEPSRAAIWTVCLSSIINIRAWMRGGREFDGDDDGWRRLF